MTSDHDVVGLQVPMHDASTVREGERVADFQKDTERALDCTMVVVGAVQPVHVGGERLALDELHREEHARAVRAGAEIVNRDDVRMIELSGDLRLFDEAERGLGIRRVFRCRSPSSPPRDGGACRTHAAPTPFLLARFPLGPEIGWSRALP